MNIDHNLLDKQINSLLTVRYHPNVVKEFNKNILTHIDGLIELIEAIQDEEKKDD